MFRQLVAEKSSQQIWGGKDSVRFWCLYYFQVEMSSRQLGKHWAVAQ